MTRARPTSPGSSCPAAAAAVAAPDFAPAGAAAYSGWAAGGAGGGRRPTGRLGEKGPQHTLGTHKLN